MSENTYIVAFKVGPSNIDAFINKLKEYNGYCPIHENCWAILSEKEPLDVLNHLEVSGNDSVIVVKSGVHAAWINAYGEENDEWLQRNL